MTPNCGFINTFNLNFFLSSSKNQVQQFKKDVSNTYTQDTIMNAHNKTQLTHERIKCALKHSICDKSSSKIFKITILSSNASSNSTKVIKCPHIKNDSILTHIDTQFKVPKSISTLILTNMNTMHELTHGLAHSFPINLRFSSLMIKKKGSFLGL